MPVKSDSEKQPLLICKYKKDILHALKESQVVIVRGQTGCGKSTQIPQYYYEDVTKSENARTNGIVCLHPRTVAAISLQKRVEEELKEKSSNKNNRVVSHRVRFSNNNNKRTRITYMTIGLMLNSLLNDDEISKYRLVILDDAHERSMETDIFLGKMKRYLAERQQLRLVIMSAVLDVEKFQAFFANSRFIDIERQMGKVQTIYRQPKQSYTKEIVSIVREICVKEKRNKQNHILVFLPTERRVISFCKELKEAAVPEIRILKIFSNMSVYERKEIFKEWPQRKVIISTNILETSVTIPGLKYVVDSGKVRRVFYDNVDNSEQYQPDVVTLAEAEQRKGVVGRITTGVCYRIYSDDLDSIFKKILVEELKNIAEETELKTYKKCVEKSKTLSQYARKVRELLDGNVVFQYIQEEYKGNI